MDCEQLNICQTLFYKPKCNQQQNCSKQLNLTLETVIVLPHSEKKFLNYTLPKQTLHSYLTNIFAIQKQHSSSLKPQSRILFKILHFQSHYSHSCNYKTVSKDNFVVNEFKNLILSGFRPQNIPTLANITLWPTFAKLP